MSHDTRHELAHEPAGRSPQRVIQRPRVPDAVWLPAIGKAHRIGRPIGHVIGELLTRWLGEDDGPTDCPNGGNELGAHLVDEQGHHQLCRVTRGQTRPDQTTGAEPDRAPARPDQTTEPDQTTTIRRRPRTPGRDKTRHYKAPDEVYEPALAAAHARGMSLGSYIVEQLERLVAEESSRP